ncbi:MAG: hypothetical protein K8U03_24535 [Planctomycetia bacterium]|nr:hypothetical protein [Planctomycetia bacterium]
MRRIMMTGVLSSCLAALTGCSKSEEQAAAPAAQPAVVQASPQTVVGEFLEAVRIGNDKVAESKLTDLAREKTRKMDLMVAPPGSPTAKFEVGGVEVVEQGQLAYVESRWTDVGADGKPEVNEFVWAMRMDNGNWRIGGVATQPYPNMPFLQLDFENPEEMLKQTQLAEQEYQRQLKLSTPTGDGTVAGAAQAPGTTTQGTTAVGGAAPVSANTGVQASFNQNGTPAGLNSNGAIQPAGGLPASPAQNNSSVGHGTTAEAAQPGTFNASGNSSNLPLQAQQPAPGNAVPR